MHSSDSEFIVRQDNAVYETDTPVLYSVAEGLATLTLHRPTFNNAQNSQMTYALDACFRQAVDDDNVKVIVLRGNGKHFSAGHDIDPARACRYRGPPRSVCRCPAGR